MRNAITAPEKFLIHPIGLKQYKKAFPLNRVDSKAVERLLVEVKKDKSLSKRQRDRAVNGLERALVAHKHVEQAQKLYGEHNPVVANYVESLRTGAKSSEREVHLMSPEYKMVLDMLAEDAGVDGLISAVSTKQHMVWDEWRGYMDPHVIVQPGSAMLPAVRPAALKAIVKALKDTLPEIASPEVQAAITNRSNRLASGLFGRGMRDVHGSLKAGGFTGSSPFIDHPRPTALSAGALYMSGKTSPSGVLDDLYDAGADMSEFFSTGDTSALFKEGSAAIMMLLGEDFPQAMDIFSNKFDSYVDDAGVQRLTSEGFGELRDAFAEFWRDKHIADAELDLVFDSLRGKLSVLWRRLRHKTDKTEPVIRRFFDEWLGVMNDAKKEGMFGVLDSQEYKNLPRVKVDEFQRGVKSELLATESVAKQGRAAEFLRIDLNEGRIRNALGTGKGVGEVDAFKTMEKAVAYVSTEMARVKYSNHWVPFSKRSIVPKSMLARYTEEASVHSLSVFGDPQKLKKQLKRVQQTRDRVNPRTGEVVIDPVTGVPERELLVERLPDGTDGPIMIEVFELDSAQQSRLRSLLLELAEDSRTRTPVQRVLGQYLEPGADLRKLPMEHYHFITQELIRDYVSGIGTGSTKEMRHVPKSLGYAAVKAIMHYPKKVAFFDEFLKGLSNQFKTRAPLTTVRKTSKGGKEASVAGDVISPVVRELYQKRLRQVQDISNWVKRIQRAMSEGRVSASVWETIEGLQNVLEQPISNYTYQRLDMLEQIFDAENGVKPSLVSQHLDTITTALANNRLMTKAERKAINLLREIEEIKRVEPEQTVIKGGEVHIKDPMMREAIGDAYYVIQQGILRRLEMADIASRTIMEAMGGSPEQAQRLFRTGDGARTAANRTKAIKFYDQFYRGEWGSMLHMLAQEGLATGTALKYPGRYNVLHAMLETVMRLRAQSIFMGLLDDMADYGISSRIADIAPADIASAAERRQFVLRVKGYLNDEIRFGGPKVVVDAETGRVMDVPEAFERQRTQEDTGIKLQGSGPGAADFGKKAKSRAGEKGAFRRYQVKDGDLLTKSVDHDLEAYTVAQQLIEQWGMKYGANIENWELTRFLDGSEALVPKMLLDEVDAAVNRVAGQASAKVGSDLSSNTLQLKSFYKGFLPEVGNPALSTKVKHTTAQALNLIFKTYGTSYRFMKMGLTTGIMVLNLPYYVANGFGAMLQSYQALGVKGYFSSMKHSILAVEVAAAMWGDAPSMRWRKMKPVVTPDGTVWTRGALTKAAAEHGLSGSFLASETARSLAADLKRSEPTAWNRIAKVPRWYHKQLINFATFIDNYHRVAIFIEGIGQGMTPSAAANLGKRAMFDYSDLTDFEKRKMRHIFIFYSFQRKNVDLFWDTLLTNPHRVMGQLRFARGLNQIFLDGDEVLIESDWSVGRMGMLFKNNAANSMIQKNRVNAPMIPITEAMRAELDFFSFLSSFIPSNNPIKQAEKGKARLRFLSRLNPWLQAPIALTMNKSFFRGSELQAERLPLFWVQHDILATGGMLMRAVDAKVRPIKAWETQDFPGQLYVWEATNTTNWYLMQNIWHGPMPTMPMRESTPVLGRIPVLGKIIDYSPLGFALRAQPIKGYKEGTLGVSPVGRMIDTLERFDRANTGFVESLLEADMNHYRSLVEKEKRGPLSEEGRLSYDELHASGLQISPETGDVEWSVPRDRYGVPYDEGGPGARGRPGVDEGVLSILLGVQQIPTEDAAILKLQYRQTRAIQHAADELERKSNTQQLDIENRPGYE